MEDEELHELAEIVSGDVLEQVAERPLRPRRVGLLDVERLAAGEQCSQDAASTPREAAPAPLAAASGHGRERPFERPRGDPRLRSTGAT